MEYMVVNAVLLGLSIAKGQNHGNLLEGAAALSKSIDRLSCHCDEQFNNHVGLGNDLFFHRGFSAIFVFLFVSSNATFFNLDQVRLIDVPVILFVWAVFIRDERSMESKYFHSGMDSQNPAGDTFWRGQ
jgi:hypothetical protein